MGCFNSSPIRVHPVDQEGREQSQPVSTSPPEAIVTPSTDKPEAEQLKVEKVESASIDEEAEKVTPKALATENELVVEDIGDEPESSPAKEPLSTSSDVVTKVECVEDSAPSALEDSPAPPELDATMVTSPLPLPIAMSSKDGAELKSASAVIVRDDDKLDLRATHSHADMDKKLGQEIDLGNICQVTSKADEPEVVASTTENEEAAEVKEASSKSSLKKVESVPTIEKEVNSEPTVPIDPPATNDADATPTKNTSADTDTPSPAEEGSPASEDNGPTEEPVADKKESSSPTPNANEGEPIPTTVENSEPMPTTVEDTTPTTNDNPPQSNEETDSPPSENKEVVPENTEVVEDKPAPSKASPTLSKKTEDSDSRKIDHNTGQSSSVELQDNNETTPTSVVQEVSA